MMRKSLLAILLVLAGSPLGAHAQAPEIARVPAGTGVNVHTWSPWNNQVDLPLIKACGFRFIRADLGWRWTEPQKNAENFSLADGWLAAAQAHGIRCIFTLDYNNPLWSGSSDDKVGLNTQANREAYARWCERAARHFAGKGVIWEIWNEPNNTAFWKPGPINAASAANYMDAASLASIAIRQYAGSSDPILGPATTFHGSVNEPGLAYLKNCIALGLLHRVDGVSVHSYQPPGRAPENVLAFYDALNVAMVAAGNPKPVVSGEWGYTRYDVSADLQARYNARSLFVNAMKGVPLSIVYNWTDSSGTTSREAQFGIVKNDSQRTKWPAYYACQAANAVINGGTLRSVITLNGGKSFLQTWSTPSAGTVYVAWHTGTGAQATATINVTGTYDVLDYLGKPIGKHTGGLLTIDSGVKYLKRGLPAQYAK